MTFAHSYELPGFFALSAVRHRSSRLFGSEGCLLLFGTGAVPESSLRLHGRRKQTPRRKVRPSCFCIRHLPIRRSQSSRIHQPIGCKVDGVTRAVYHVTPKTAWRGFDPGSVHLLVLAADVLSIINILFHSASFK